jgi:hypothetical protein
MPGAPGAGLAVRETKLIAPQARDWARFRLNGTTKGKLYTVKLVPVAQARIYGARIWARVLGPAAAAWQWYPVQIIETPNEWTPVKLAIPPMGEWEPRSLQVPPMGEWTPQALGVPMVTDWMPTKLPISPTPITPEWYAVEVDE